MEKLFYFLTDSDLSTNMTYLVVFGILVACGLGFPLPEDIPLIASGYLVWDGTMNWFPAILVTMLGVLLGDTILFYLGKKMGLKILEKEKVQTLFKPEKIRRTRAYFRKYGDKIIFFARFVAGFRAAAFFMAGAMKMRYSRFLLLDSMAAAISVPLWVLIGWAAGNYLGSEISEILKSIRHLKTAITAVILTIVALMIVRAFVKFQKAKKAGRGPSGRSKAALAARGKIV
jgi:membrane protein DedA with SNARE-associated domain